MGHQQEITFVSSHIDIRMRLQVLGEKVAQSVIFLFQDEVGGVGHAYESSLRSPIGQSRMIETHQNKPSPRSSSRHRRAERARSCVARQSQSS